MDEILSNSKNKGSMKYLKEWFCNVQWPILSLKWFKGGRMLNISSALLLSLEYHMVTKRSSLMSVQKTSSTTNFLLKKSEKVVYIGTHLQRRNRISDIYRSSTNSKIGKYIFYKLLYFETIPIDKVRGKSENSQQRSPLRRSSEQIGQTSSQSS